MIDSPAVRDTDLSGSTNVWSFLLYLTCLALVVTGYTIKERHYIDAANGMGYWLGVVGGILMLALLAYPLQKRYRLFHSDNSHLKHWFMTHMLLGIIGPLCILFHSNFSLGSINSNVALYSMLAMVSSGFVGRFLYAKTHFGLYGRLCTMQELLAQTNQARRELVSLEPELDHETYWLIHQSLEEYQNALKRHRSMLSHAFLIIALGWKTRRTQSKLNALARQAKLVDKDEHSASLFTVLQNDIQTILATTRRTAELGFYKQLFSLWHLFHLPIFFMLLVTGFIHVYAVHSY